MPYDDGALRTRLKMDFDALTHGATEASNISNAYKELSNAAARILAGLVRDWSAIRDDLWMLPDEVFACVFELLPFRDRVGVSHVCRRWRSIALAHPAIWAEIDEPELCANGQALVCMALERTGQHPVSLAWHGDATYGPELLSSVARHMCHIQKLSWTGDYEALPLNVRAPLLSIIQARSLDVTSDFLGGEAGDLSTLCIYSLYLPETCWALSSVTVLEICGPVCEVSAARYDQLFVLCQRLERLHISELVAHLAHTLPEGPAPESLDELYLEGIEDDHYDLTRHYTAWKTRDNLSSVTLAQDCSSPADLAALIGGAVKLEIGEEDAPERTEIFARGPDGDWVRRIGFQNVWEGHTAHVARLISDVREVLPDLEALDIELSYLDDFMPLIGGWKALARLTLRIAPAEPAAFDPYCWCGLSRLSQLTGTCPSLASIVICVVTSRDSRPPNDSDARDLLARLSLCDLPDVLVKGFSQTVLANIKMPDQMHGRGDIRFAYAEDSHFDLEEKESLDGDIDIAEAVAGSSGSDT